MNMSRQLAVYAGWTCAFVLGGALLSGALLIGRFGRPSFKPSSQTSSSGRVPATGVPATGVPATVIGVVDGDTIVVDLRGRKEKVRLLNVDTPESVHPDPRRNTPEGEAAGRWTRERLLGRRVLLEWDGDGPARGRYGRLLAYVWLDGRNFNLELVRAGLSPYYTKYGPGKYPGAFRQAEAAARTGDRGENSGPALPRWR